MSGIILLFLFAVALLNNCKGNNISDQRLCYDAKCSVPISLALGLVEYVRNQDQVLSFHRGDEITIYSKSAGTRQDLWGAKIRGVRGYIPKSVVREIKVYHPEVSLKYTVSTKEEPESKEPIVSDQKEGSGETPQTTESVHSSELPSNTDINPDLYNVIDGTTIYPDPAMVATPTVSSLNTYYSEGSSATMEPTPFSSTMDEMSTLSAEHSDMSPISPTTMKEKSEELENGIETSETPSNSESVLKSVMNLVPDLFSGGGDGHLESDSSKSMAKDDQKEEPSDDGGNIEPFAVQPTLNSAESNLGDPIESEKINDLGSLQKDGEESKANVKVIREMEVNEDDAEDNDEDDEDGDEEEDDDDGEEEDDVDEEEKDGVMEEMVLDEAPPKQSDSQGSIEDKHTLSNSDSYQEEGAGGSMASEDKKINLPQDEPLAREKNQENANEIENVSNEIPPNDSPMDDTGLTDVGRETLPEGGSDGHSSLHIHHQGKGDSNPNEHESGSLSHSITEELENTNGVNVGPQHDKNLNVRSDTSSSIDSSTPKSDFSDNKDHVNNFLTSDPENPMNGNHIHQDEVLSSHANPGKEDEHKSVDKNDLMASNSTAGSTSNSIPIESEEKRPTLITGDQDLVVDNNDISHSSMIPPSQFEQTNHGILHTETERVDTNPIQNVMDEKEIHLEKPYVEDVVPKENANDVTGIDIDSNVNKEATQTEVTEINHEEGNVGETPNVSDSLEQMLVTEESSGFFSMLSEPFNSGYTFLTGIFFGKEDDVQELDVHTSDVGVEKHFETEDEQQHSERDDGASRRYMSLFGSNSLSHCESHPTDSQCENLSTPLPAAGEPSSNVEGQSSRVEEESSSWMEFVALPLGYEYASIFDIHMPSYGALIYPLITGGVVLCFFLGHYFIEGKRRDELLLAKINTLEKELTVSSKECLILKERLKVSESKSSSLDDSTEVINSIKSELEKVQNEKAQLEKELEATTEAGLEMELMVSQFLSSQPDSKSLMESIEQLQAQANKQQTKISILENSLISKTQENEKLAQELSLTEQKVQELEEDLKQVSENLNERDQDHCKQYEELKKLSENQKKEYEEDLKNKLVETEMAITRCKSLEKSLTESKDILAVKENEIGVLQECLQKLKVSNGDDPEKAAVQFQEMLDFGKLKAELISVTKERDSLKEELMGEEDARKLLEDHVKVIREEVEKLRKCHEAAEREKVEAQTRLEVLSSYFKEKESQLQKELGIQEAMRVQKHTDASTIMQRMKSLEEEVENYSKEVGIQKTIINGDANVKGRKEIVNSTSEKERKEKKVLIPKVLESTSKKGTKEIISTASDKECKEEKHLKRTYLSGKEDIDSKVKVVDDANDKSTKEVVVTPPEKHGKEEKQIKTKCVYRKEDNHSKTKVADDASDKSTKEIVGEPGKEEKHLKTKCLSGKEDNRSKIKTVDNTGEKSTKEIFAAPPEKHGKVEKQTKCKVVDIASDKTTKDIDVILPEKHGSQNETLKKEILDQERGYKTQVATFEKKAHENWVAARQAERKLEEAKQEAGQLRNRLTMVDKSNPISSSQNGDDSKPNLSMMDSNGELSASPLHLGLASNTSVDMLLSDQHPLYLDPNSSPPHVGGGGGRLPPPPLLPPFPPPPFPPRSPYHHPLSPPLPFMPPPPDSALYPSAVDGHRPPPLGRMSSPPPPPSPSHSPHLPSVDSRAGEYPSPYRDRGGGGGRSSSPSPGLYRSMPLDDRGMVDEWGLGRYRTPPPHHPNNPPDFSIPPPYPPHHHRPHWEDDSHHPTTSFRPLPTQLDPLREHKGGRSKGSHSSESDMLDKSSRHGGKL